MRSVNVKFNSVDMIVEFVNAVENFSADIDLKYGLHIIDAKSILGVIYLGTCKMLELIIHDDDCEELLKKLSFCLA